MVALVLVSHSRALALALHETLKRLYGDKTPPVAVAAGAGDDGETLGTDATAILSAIQEVAPGSGGVLILLDLGSAVLSAELALDLLDEEARCQVAISSAPLVEGAIAAAAQCSIGASLAEVRAEAENALRQKITHLGDGAATGTSPAPPPGSTEPELADAPRAVVELRVENPHGLHARPAMRIAQAAASYRSTVQIENLRTGAPAASARSLVAITCLDARTGDTVRVTARGPDASEVVRALELLHAEQFGDLAADQPAESAPRAAATGLPAAGGKAGEDLPRGVALSDGIALGTLVFGSSEPPALPPPPGSIQPAVELGRLRAALAVVRDQLKAGGPAAAARFGAANASILQAHELLLDDPALVDRAAGLIEQNHLPAAHAWWQASQHVAAMYRQLEQPLLRERARDVEDLGQSVLRELGVALSPRFALPEAACVLAVPVLLPSEVSLLDSSRVKGVIAEAIGQTSHAAILLRAAGIPAVEGVPVERLREIVGGRAVSAAIDGGTGEVWLEPDAAILQQLADRRAPAATGASGRAGPEPLAPLHTRDGFRVELAANVTSVADARNAARAGAEAIGLLRTEFLFFDRAQAPSEDEQTEALRQIAAAMPAGAPITIRTIDIGGDKPVPYLDTALESNPFLGVRGLRLALEQPALFATHLRAILRAAHGYHVRIMFPMVTEVAEVRQARGLLLEAHGQLALARVEHAWPVETGMMVEVPAAGLNARSFVDEVDFFSIGTNDLTQYTLAAERGHPRLAHFADALHPAVLRLIARVAAVATRAGKWVGVCGESAADPAAAAIFIGLGIKELSVGPGALGRLRAAIGSIDQRQARRIARRSLQTASSAEVRSKANQG